MTTATNTTSDRDIRSVTIGAFRSRHKGEILLIYFNDGQADAAILRYDQLSGTERHLVRTTAQDPLGVLKRTKTGRKMGPRAA
jgi:hypothetical protein